MNYKKDFPVFLCLSIFLIWSVGCSGGFGSGENDGSGEIDGLKLGVNLELHLKDLKPAKFDKKGTIKKVESYFNNSPKKLDTIRIYEAKSEIDGSTVPLSIVVFSLENEKFSGAILAVAVREDNTVHRVRIWGNEFVDSDSRAAIENFYRQFDKKRKVLPLSKVFTEKEVDSYIQKVSEADRYRYTHARKMLNNNYLIRGTMAVTRQNEVPDIQFYKDIRDDLIWLRENADKIKSEDTSTFLDEYKKEAQSAEKALAEIIKLIKGGASPRQVRSAISNVRKTTCTTCHSIPSAPNKPKIYDQLREDFLASGMRQDLFRVNFDVWGIPNMTDGSQYLANLVKAGLISLEVTKVKQSASENNADCFIIGNPTGSVLNSVSIQ